MPNWCSCDLNVDGDEATLKEFMEFAKGRGVHDNREMLLDMDRFIPYPKKFEDMDEKHAIYSKIADELREKLVKEGIDIGKSPEFKKAWDDYVNNKDGYNSGGYEWCIENWGTKWNFADIEVINNIGDGWDGGIRYTFDTAWSPPTPVILAMSKKFPTLKFDLRYFEQGAGFNGMFRCEAGEVTDDKTGDYFGDRGG